MTRVFRAAFVAAISGLLCSAAAFAGDDLWTQDYKAALEKAKAGNLDVLVDFTGSDWCIWCQRLDQEVFDTDAFKAESPKQYVLVKLDFPRDKSIVTDVTRAQNEDLVMQYGVEGFPSIFMLDSSGRPFGKTGYEAGGPEAYFELLAKQRENKTKRDAAFTAAAALEGVAKAKALDEALEQLAAKDVPVLPFYRAEFDVIVSLDPKDEAGLKTKYTKSIEDFAKTLEVRKQGMLEAKLQSLAQEYAEKSDFAGMRTALEAFAAEHDGNAALLQKTDMLRALTYAQEKNFDEAVKLLDEAIKRLPDSEFVAQIEGIKAQLMMAKTMAGGADDGEDDEGADEPAPAPAPAPAPTGGGH